MPAGGFSVGAEDHAHAGRCFRALRPRRGEGSKCASGEPGAPRTRAARRRDTRARCAGHASRALRRSRPHADRCCRPAVHARARVRASPDPPVLEVRATLASGRCRRPSARTAATPARPRAAARGVPRPLRSDRSEARRARLVRGAPPGRRPFRSRPRARDSSRGAASARRLLARALLTRRVLTWAPTSPSRRRLAHAGAPLRSALRAATLHAQRNAPDGRPGLPSRAVAVAIAVPGTAACDPDRHRVVRGDRSRRAPSAEREMAPGDRGVAAHRDCCAVVAARRWRQRRMPNFAGTPEFGSRERRARPRALIMKRRRSPAAAVARRGLRGRKRGQGAGGTQQAGVGRFGVMIARGQRWPAGASGLPGSLMSCRGAGLDDHRPRSGMR